MISKFSFFLINLPITVFIYLIYVSFLNLHQLEYLILLTVLYLILCFDAIADDAFRKSFILMLINAVGQSGRVIIYLFLAIVLITGPIHDIHRNIILLVKSKATRNEDISHQDLQGYKSQETINLRHQLYHIIHSHIQDHLLKSKSIQSLCETADNWNTFSGAKNTTVCSDYSRTHKSLSQENEFQVFLHSLFNFGSYYGVQRAFVLFVFVYCSFRLPKVSLRFRRDMSFNNWFITKAVDQLESQEREQTTASELDEEEDNNVDSDDESHSEERMHLQRTRKFQRTLPLTNLERKKYILSYSYGYLDSELFGVFERFQTFIWISFLFVSIVYFHFTLLMILHEDASHLNYVTVTMSRLWVASIYVFAIGLFIVCEPVAYRVHQQLLERFFPAVAERRARILMLTIRLRRKSFVEINRLNIHLRFNKSGTVWTAIRSFIEDTSLADFLGRPSGFFCSICEKEAQLPKEARKCSTYSCPCVYCNNCYEQIRHICLNCNKKYDETVVVRIHPHAKD